jgi:hypothetical protein
MEDNVEDGTEGGYTASAEIPPEELEKMRRMRPQFFTDNIDEQYDEAMELFGGKPIPKIGEPAEYIITDRNMVPSLSEAYRKALIEKYGHIPELNEMVAVDEEPDD